MTLDKTVAPRPDSQSGFATVIPRWAERRLPLLRLLHSYQRAWLRADLLAAVSVCAILIPQGMGYGNLAGAAPVAGLYAALAAMVAYAIFGTSRQLMVGPEAGSAILIASTLAPLVGGDDDPTRYAALAGLLALLTGAFLIGAGLGGLGFVADYLSKPVMVGYINGAALTIIASQLGKLFGIGIESQNFFPQVCELLTELGTTEWPTLVFGVTMIALLVLLRRIAPKVPSTLVVVIISTLLVAMFDLTRYGVSVVGSIPTGLPGFRVPLRGLPELAALIPGALSLAVLIFPDSTLTARAFAERHGYAIDANQELIALGADNVAESGRRRARREVAVADGRQGREAEIDVVRGGWRRRLVEERAAGDHRAVTTPSSPITSCATPSSRRDNGTCRRARSRADASTATAIRQPTGCRSTIASSTVPRTSIARTSKYVDMCPVRSPGRRCAERSRVPHGEHCPRRVFDV